MNENCWVTISNWNENNLCAHFPHKINIHKGHFLFLQMTNGHFYSDAFGCYHFKRIFLPSSSSSSSPLLLFIHVKFHLESQSVPFSIECTHTPHLSQSICPGMIFFGFSTSKFSNALSLSLFSQYTQCVLNLCVWTCCIYLLNTGKIVNIVIKLLKLIISKSNFILNNPPKSASVVGVHLFNNLHHLLITKFSYTWDFLF